MTVDCDVRYDRNRTLALLLRSAPVGIAIFSENVKQFTKIDASWAENASMERLQPRPNK